MKLWYYILGAVVLYIILTQQTIEGFEDSKSEIVSAIVNYFNAKGSKNHTIFMQYAIHLPSKYDNMKLEKTFDKLAAQPFVTRTDVLEELKP